MSDNQRNTTKNESDSDTAVTTEAEDVETVEKDAVGGGATEAGDAEEESTDPKSPDAEEESTGSTALTASTESSSEAEGVGTASEPEEDATVPEPSEAAEDTADREEPAADSAEAEGSAVTESKGSVPKGPNAVKATMSSRKAHLTVSRVEPWSVMKFSFVVSLVGFIILFVAVGVVYATLSMLGVFDELTNMINALLEGDGGDDELGLNPAAWFSPGRVLGYTGVVGALNIVLLTALSTVGAMLYNLVADLVGGLDVTLSEAE